MSVFWNGLVVIVVIVLMMVFVFSLPSLLFFFDTWGTGQETYSDGWDDFQTYRLSFL
jgi:hypothetical protein